MIKKVKEKISIHGDILIRVRNKKTGKIEYRKHIQNQITNWYLNEIIKPIYGTTPDVEIAHLAFGTGTTTPTSTDSTLDTETYRISDTSLERTATGQVTSEFVLDGEDYIAEVASGQIEEIGFFASSSSLPWAGGSGKDTGLLISRVLFDYDITVDQEIYFNRVDTFVAG